MCERTEGYRPVSYTHLDVYKRQRFRRTRYMLNEHSGRGTRQARNRMMFRQPVSFKSPLLDMPRQVDRASDCTPRQFARPHAHQIQYGNRELVTHVNLDDPDSNAMPISNYAWRNEPTLNMVYPGLNHGSDSLRCQSFPMGRTLFSSLSSVQIGDQVIDRKFSRSEHENK